MPFNTQPPYNVVLSVDETASRDFNIDYTNNTGRTMFVTITTNFTTPNAGEVARITGWAGGAQKGVVGITGGIAGLAIQCEQNLVVKPGEVYKSNKVITGAATATLVKWIETY